MFGCISLQGNVVQTHGYNPLGDIFKAVYKLATYNRQKHRFLNFFSVRSNLSSIFLYSSKSACFKPWHFIDFSKQMSNIFSPCHLHYFWQCLLRLPFLCPPQDTCKTPGSLEGSSAWWRWEPQNRKHGCGRTLQTLLVLWLMLCWDGASQQSI